MKSLWLLLLLFVPTPLRASQDLLPELVRRIKPSAVAIETFDSRGEKLSRGSGFFVEADRIVTNRHVLEGAHRAEVHSSTGAIFPVKGVLAVDAEGDAELILAQSHDQRTLGERDEARRRSGNLDGGGREQGQRQHLHDGSSGSGMGSALAAVKIALPPTRHKRSILTGAAKSAHPSSGANKRPAQNG